jgi:hypothetical protein
MRKQTYEMVILEIGDHVMRKLEFSSDQFSGFSGTIVGFQGDNYEERLAIIHTDERFRADSYNKPFKGEYFVLPCKKLSYLPPKEENK